MAVVPSSMQQVASVTARPVPNAAIGFGREICGDLDAALRREWLVTNGLGGYASGTIAGVSTRRYHGLLVAALNPPVDRTVLVGGLLEFATYDGVCYPLSTHEYEGGTVDPRGYVHIQSFYLDGALPVWVYALGDALLEKRVWMEYGANTTYVSYRLLRGKAPFLLEVTPLVTYRNFHMLSRGAGWSIATEALPSEVVVRAWDGAVPFRVAMPEADYHSHPNGGEWYWNFHYRVATERGLDDVSDLFVPGTFVSPLYDGGNVTLVLTTEPNYPDPDAALPAALARQQDLLHLAGAEAADPLTRQLVLAADQFIVSRSAGEGEAGKTVIAGYHWFNDWGRDTMIALPGLTLATGRAADAEGILRAFSHYVQDGLLPNNFPDQAGVVPGYNTVDATLWYVHAIHAYEQATGDAALVDDLLPVLLDIADHHVRGTRYGIGVDPSDGLLRAGEPGVQLTWMDAKIGDWVVTPRIGKPVEINALWYNLLCILTRFLDAREHPAAGTYRALSERVRVSFNARFIRPGLLYLPDVIDGPDGDDLTLRPNQILAASLPYSPINDTTAAWVVDAVGHKLLTSYGLRSLSPDDPAYRADYFGDPYRRDSSYHQGPVWTWLIGAFVEAHYRVHRDRAAAIALLRPFQNHLRDAGLGSISEILEGGPPHLPRGCIAQAWGVSEVLRVWRRLALPARTVSGQ